MSRLLRARSLCASCLAVCLALIGAGASSEAQASTKLAVAKVANDFALMMVDYGNKLGTFAKNGLDVEVTQITQAKMIQAVVAGSIDMALGSGAVLAFIPKGAPLTGVAALSGPPSILVLIVRPDRSITALDQLRGRVVAITNQGSLTDWAVSQIALHENWTPSDIPRVSVGDTMARVAALKVKNVDAAVIDIATALELEQRGEAKILVNFGDLITKFQNQIIYASNNLIKTNPGAVRAFNSGWFATLDYARAHKNETTAFAEQDLGVSADVAGRVYDKLMPRGFFSTDGRFDRAVLESMSESFVDMKLVDHKVDLSQFVTEQFLPKE
ncbi:MAG TPA: ABC transporter substrate-binding protein [Xanthobacteraceae bacterium]|nr:ABC transporter substrate-binding protein [Xanthobacteraceae bacterium]